MRKLIYLTVLMAAAAALSCTKMDDYLKYAENSDRIYTGKLDTVIFYAGKERMKFHGELSSDPKVNKIGIFWTSGTEEHELMIDVEYEPGKIVEQEIQLAEGTYNFTIYTYDADGHSSIPMNVSGASYGDVYMSGLYNRVVKASEVIDGDIVIDWYAVSEDSPYSKVTYETSDGETATVTVPSDEERTTLENAANNIFEVTTYYLPEEGAIDEFAPAAKRSYAVSDVTAMYLKNAGVDDGNGDPNIEKDPDAPEAGGYSIPKDWKVNDAALNYDANGTKVGGWRNEDRGRIAFRKWDNDGQFFQNGKVWQTATLPAGTYEFSTKYCRCNTDWNKAVLHIVVAEGTELPDHDPEYYRINNNSEWSKPAPDEPELQNSIAYKRLEESDGGDKFVTITFTLEQETEVSLGLVATVNGNQHLDFSCFKLVQTN